MGRKEGGRDEGDEDGGEDGEARYEDERWTIGGGEKGYEEERGSE